MINKGVKIIKHPAQKWRGDVKKTRQTAQRSSKSMEFLNRTWARICKRLRGPEIDCKESIPAAYVARRAGKSNRVFVRARQAVNRFLGSLKGLQIRALCNLSMTGTEWALDSLENIFDRFDTIASLQKFFIDIT